MTQRRTVVRNRRRREGRAGSPTRALLRRELNGVTGRPAGPVRNYVVVPWNVLEIRFEGALSASTAVTMTLGSLQRGVLRQAGLSLLSGSVRVNVRLVMVKAWVHGSASEISQTVTFTPRNQMTDSSTNLGQFPSTAASPTTIRPATYSFTWPQAQAAFVHQANMTIASGAITGGSTTSVFDVTIDGTPTGVPLVVYARVLWRLSPIDVDRRPTACLEVDAPMTSMAMEHLASDLNRLDVVERLGDRVLLIEALSPQQGDALDSEDRDLALAALPSSSNPDRGAIARQTL